MIRYRDTRTGRAVSEATWRRSKAHGGTRYKRVQQPRRKPPKKKKKREITPPPPPRPTREYFVVANYPKKKGEKQKRLTEAIVTLPDGATDEEIKKAYGQFLIEKKWNPRSVENLLREPLKFKIVPRDIPGSDVPSGSVRVNDARKPKKRKGEA